MKRMKNMMKMKRMKMMTHQAWWWCDAPRKEHHLCYQKDRIWGSDCELLWIEISHKKGKTLLGVFYKPAASSTDYLCRLRNSLALIADSCSIVLCGDFNIPNVNWDSSVPTVSSPKASLLCDIALSWSLKLLDATTHSIYYLPTTQMK